MPKPRKPIWDVLSEEKKKECINNIIAFFLDERDEKIGVVAAEQILDVVMESAFADIYNQGVISAQKLIQKKMADMNIDLDLLLAEQQN